MKIKFLFFPLLIFSVITLADETISVYPLDSSIHCQTIEIITPAKAAETLQKAGVKVMSSTCGTPTGKAKVYVVDVGGWNKMASEIN